MTIDADTKTAPEVETDDPDELALQAALAEAEAEEKGKAPGKEEGSNDEPAADKGGPDNKAVEKTPEVSEDDPENESSPMIPKARLDKVLSERKEAEARAAYLEGQLEAFKSQNAAPKQPASGGPTSQDAINHLRRQVELAAQKYDDGEISLAEFKRYENQVGDRIDQIKEAGRPRARPEVPAQKIDISAEIQKENFIQKLEEQYPYSKDGVITGEGRWPFLQAEARQLLKNEGIERPSDHQWLEAVAKMAQQYGPMWAGELSAPATNVQTSNPKPAPSEVEAKLKLAAQHPANSGEVGSAGVHEGMTDSKIEAMSEDEFDALPDAVRNKLLGLG